ncbi:exopolysaccharide biosynthesis polyprenyl glycosylphosphotransferase [Terrarubrum flagellatum]|uniref:exopolysaccharide biosynthesis polyprenyl glycosylphosphotransferase n=1 Tax=Terrirubrum flagellatum TaxID=2895980 RepID=UPI003144FEC6
MSYDAVGAAMSAVDFVLILMAAEIGSWFYHSVVSDLSRDPYQYAAIGLVAAALIIPLSHVRGVYQPPKIRDFTGQVVSLLLVWGGSVALLTICAFALKVGSQFSRGGTLTFAALTLLSLAGNRLFWKRYLDRGLSAGALAPRRVGVITDGSRFARNELPDLLRRCGFEIAEEMLLDNVSDGRRAAARQAAEQAVAHFRGARIDEIIVATSWRRMPFVMQMERGLRGLPLPVRFVMEPAISEIASRPKRSIGDLLSLEMQAAPMSVREQMLKRGLDIAIASFALLLLAPLLVIVALAIKLDSPGPALFLQIRRGFNNQPFQIIKFRSMSVMENGATIAQAKRQDPRVTRVGKWIRRTSIDELPQLWNVLRGEMSLVGPRPHAAAHDSFYERELGGYAFRQHVLPGLTGWAQVNGSRGETPTMESMARRVELDTWYVNNRSIFLDIKILFLTVIQAVSSRNAY